MFGQDSKQRDSKPSRIDNLLERLGRNDPNLSEANFTGQRWTVTSLSRHRRHFDLASLGDIDTPIRPTGNLKNINLLAEALKNNTYVVTLNVSQGTLTDDAIAILAPVLANCASLSRLILAHNQISDQGAQLLAQHLANSRLEVLDISHNRLTLTGVKSLLTHVKSLSDLDISHNQVGDEKDEKADIKLEVKVEEKNTPLARTVSPLPNQAEIPTSQPLVDPSRKRLRLIKPDDKLADKAKTIFQNELKGTPLILGFAYSEGDCFFDSFAQSLAKANIALPAGIPTPLDHKQLRLLCQRYVEDLDTKPSASNWVEEQIKRGEVFTYQHYLQNIGFTQAEILARQKQGQGDGISIWGIPQREGRILCAVLNVQLHVIELSREALQQDVITKAEQRLYDAKGDSSITSSQSHDLSIIHIAVYRGHNVPLLPKAGLKVEADFPQLLEESEQVLVPTLPLPASTPSQFQPALPVLMPSTDARIPLLWEALWNSMPSKDILLLIIGYLIVSDTQDLAIPVLLDSKLGIPLTLNASFNRMGGQAVTALTQTVKKIDQTFRAVNLNKNRLGDAGIVVLASNLAEHPTLQALHLQHNRFTARGAKALAQLILNLPHLQVLDVSFNPIADAGISVLSTGLQARGTTLRELYLRHTEISTNGTQTLVDLFKTLPHLEQLDLRDNQLQGGIAAVTRAVSRHQRLYRLQLDDNRVQPADVKAALSHLNVNRSLLHLSISEQKDSKLNNETKAIMQTYVERNQAVQRRLAINWGAVALLIAFQRANAGSMFIDSILPYVSQITTLASQSFTRTDNSLLKELKKAVRTARKNYQYWYIEVNPWWSMFHRHGAAGQQRALALQQTIDSVPTFGRGIQAVQTHLNRIEDSAFGRHAGRLYEHSFDTFLLKAVKDNRLLGECLEIMAYDLRLEADRRLARTQILAYRHQPTREQIAPEQKQANQPR
jgi:Ran GTPase-activating protein (RanGAP) involved in mRNA processing and transport